MKKLLEMRHSLEEVRKDVLADDEGLAIWQRAEQDVRSQWRLRLERAGARRDADDLGQTDAALDELGLPSALNFFAKLQTSPYPLRYYGEPMMLAIRTVSLRGINIPAYPTTVLWACESIADQLEHKLRSAPLTPP